MNTIIIILTSTVSIIGIVISLKTIIDTRKKYFKDYVQRKREEKA